MGLSVFLIRSFLSFVGCGGSVASAIAASTSRIRFIQSNCVTLKGLHPIVVTPVKTNNKHVMLTVNWNYMNLRALSKMLRPHLAAFFTDAKLSSSKTMSEWA